MTNLGTPWHLQAAAAKSSGGPKFGILIVILLGIFGVLYVQACMRIARESANHGASYGRSLAFALLSTPIFAPRLLDAATASHPVQPEGIHSGVSGKLGRTIDNLLKEIDERASSGHQTFTVMVQDRALPLHTNMAAAAPIIIQAIQDGGYSVSNFHHEPNGGIASMTIDTGSAGQGGVVEGGAVQPDDLPSEIAVSVVMSSGKTYYFQRLYNETVHDAIVPTGTIEDCILAITRLGYSIESMEEVEPGRREIVAKLNRRH